ncbi:MAG: sulfatase/phosphatase domain-containing protein, partial [Planctomycetota bacterium]
HPVDPQLSFFPENLQEAGYETAFVGKWHMGDVDEPQRGFDHWVAFRGQGTYYADGHGATRIVPQSSFSGFNVNGKRVPQRGYITDELTDYALEWLSKREKQRKPFFLYLSHKAVHSDFVARDGERGMYRGKRWSPPASMADTPQNRAGKPRWVTDKRNSRHGVDFGYNLDEFSVERWHRRYCEALTAVDDNVGRTMEYLRKHDLLDDTLIIYMGDNGFQFGEHGLIDKRTAYEASIRVPLLMHYPRALTPGAKVRRIVANIDVAPTILQAAGVEVPPGLDGQSAWDLALGRETPWRDALLYEYYWEWNYPQTPSIFAVIGERYKYIRSHGVWDTDELYDMQRDPGERTNLIRQTAQAEVAKTMRATLFELLESSGGLRIPLQADRGRQFFYRHPERAVPGSFPRWFYDEPAPVRQ